MDLSNLIGNERVKQYLTTFDSSSSRGGTLLFAGPEGIGKSLFARALFPFTRKHHPDLFHFRPAGKIAMHPIDQLRLLRQEAHLPPTEAPFRLFIIDDAERMLPPSANALLKILEEPPPTALIILLSSQPESLLATIRSRCRILHFQPLTIVAIQEYLQTQHGISFQEAQRIAHLANGSIGTALHLSRNRSTIDQCLNLLTIQEHNDFHQLSQTISELGKALEAQRVLPPPPDKMELLSPTQREAQEKEAEATASRAFSQHVDTVLRTILFWFRDLHLLHTINATHLVYHQEHLPTLLQQKDHSDLPSLSKVESAVSNARTAIARHTKPAAALETMWLQLGLFA